MSIGKGRPGQGNRMSSGLLSLAVILGLAAAGARAQTNDEINAGLQLSFSPPGARSLAMGSAFSGLADDATAAYANPAGLIWLDQSEVSAEGRSRRYTTRYPDQGNAAGDPTGRGIDTLADLVFADRESSTEGLSFLSYVHVINRDLRFAIYRHELADFKAEIESQGPFIRSDAGNGTRSRLAAVAGEMSLRIESLSAVLAYRLSERFWVGVGVSLFSSSIDASTRRYVTVLSRHPTSRAIFEPVDLLPANESDRHGQHSDDDDFGAQLGLLWKGKNRRWSLGLVYHLPPEFELDYNFEWGARAIANAAGDSDGDGVIDSAPNLNFADPGVVRGLSGQGRFRVPDVLSLGVMFRPQVSLTLSFEYVAVGYSRMEPARNILFLGLASPGSCGDFSSAGDRQEVPCVADPERLSRFRIDDVEEVHFGLEYVLRRQRPIALRLGAWLDPDHQLRYEGIGLGAPEDRFAPRFLAGEDEIHWTGGLGIALRRLQLDFGGDFSDRADILSLSGVYRF